jgi:small-conductance mechanosensitive channel
MPTTASPVAAVLVQFQDAEPSSPTSIPEAGDNVDIFDGCTNGGFLCEEVYNLTGSDTAADWTAFLVGGPLVIICILIAAWILNRLARRAVTRLGVRLQERAIKNEAEFAERPASSPKGAADWLTADDSSQARARQRTEALAGVLRSLTSVAIWSMAFLLILAQVGINLGPLIAGAGILGVALGFGAQSLVADFLTGFFMLVEDQFGVGDNVDVGEAKGVVEKVTLRTTVVRDISGTVWHVPNSKIERVGNRSQLWARALLDIGIAYDADVVAAEAAIRAASHGMTEDAEWADKILEDPQVLGVEELAADQVTIRLMFKTLPAEQWNVQRELRRRIKDALDDAGIEIPFPQRTVWLRSDEGADAAA